MQSQKVLSGECGYLKGPQWKVVVEGARLHVYVLLFAFSQIGLPTRLLLGEGNVAELTPGHQSARGCRSADSASVYPMVMRLVRTRRFILASLAWRC